MSNMALTTLRQLYIFLVTPLVSEGKETEEVLWEESSVGVFDAEEVVWEESSVGAFDAEPCSDTSVGSFIAMKTFISDDKIDTYSYQLSIENDWGCGLLKLWTAACGQQEGGNLLEHCT